MTHPAALEPDRLLADCEVRFTRRSGPGGQNRNKVETAAILTHRPTGLVAEANERRSQGENRKVALRRLRVLLALEVRGEGQVGGPSDLWRSRCQGGRVVVSPEHDDFPALLAEALDVVAALDFDVKEAAGALRCSTSQLVRFLKDEPRALAMINDARRERGQHTLR
jgi:hypothetical protein